MDVLNSHCTEPQAKRKRGRPLGSGKKSTAVPQDDFQEAHTNTAKPMTLLAPPTDLATRLRLRTHAPRHGLPKLTPPCHDILRKDSLQTDKQLLSGSNNDVTSAKRTSASTTASPESKRRKGNVELYQERDEVEMLDNIVVHHPSRGTRVGERVMQRSVGVSTEDDSMPLPVTVGEAAPATAKRREVVLDSEDPSSWGDMEDQPDPIAPAKDTGAEGGDADEDGELLRAFISDAEAYEIERMPGECPESTHVAVPREQLKTYVLEMARLQVVIRGWLQQAMDGKKKEVVAFRREIAGDEEESESDGEEAHQVRLNTYSNLYVE